MSTTAPQARHTVTALIVAHDGARLLPGLVQALQAQTYQVEQTVGVDTGSRDRSGAVLAELIGQDAVFGMNRSTGYGEAVSVALRHATRRRSGTTDPGVARVEWIWLLHDDCEPAPDALEKLLRAASKDRTVVVVGPKVLDGHDRRTLCEVGVSIDRASRRVTGIEPGEIDQGQHDHKRAVLAVGSAGMLVRRDVWDRLGGFDPSLKLFRDDIDFCWRVQAAGLRVQVATDAVLYHRELSARRRRPTEGGNARLLDRRNALYVLAVNLPLLTMLRVVGGCIVGSLIRAAYFLLTKQLDLSASYAFSVLALFAHPVRLIRGRRRRAAGMAEGYTAVRLFIPPARTFSRLAEKIAGLIGNGPPQATYGRHQATVEESEEDEQFVDQQSVLRRVIGHPGVQLFTALLVIALVAERRLLGGNPLGGGALVPAWGGAAALWHEYLAGFHAVSVGSTASAPPYLAVVAMLATLLGGQAWLAVDVLLLGCVPLAGLTAYLATRWLVSAMPARVLLAASYALLPVATGAVAAGRLGTAVAFILLPLIAVSAGRMLTAAPRQAHRAAWATGLLIAVAAAFAPLTWVLGLVLAIGAVAARRWLVAVSPVNAAIVAVTPFFVLFPWSLHLLSSPSAFLSEAGRSTTGLTTRGLSPTALLALSPGGPGVPPAWVTIGLGLALVALVLPARRTQLLIAGWAAAIVGILAAVLVSRVSVTPTTGGQPAGGWPGVATALAALGLLLAAAPAAQWLATILQNGGGELSSATASPGGHDSPGGYGRSRRLLAGVALAAAATAPLLVAAYWVRDGVRGPVSMITAPLLPAYVSASSTSGQQYRTLILRPDGGSLDYMVVRQGDPTLGEPELGTSAAAGAALSRQVAALGAPDGADAGDPGLVLGSFGIRWVLMPGPVSPVIAQRLDAALGLAALNKGPSYDLWQVTGPVARVSVVAADGTTTALSSGAVNASGVTAPASGGTLVLAEPYGGWTATLNGQALKPVATPVNGWAQGFVLPPGGGQLTITRDNLARVVSLFVELIAVLVVALLALPGKRVDPVKEAQALTALREARSGRRAATSARRAGHGVRAAGAGHRAAAGALGRFGLTGKRPVSPATDEESAGLVPAGQAAAASPPGAATDGASTAGPARAASARPRAALPVGLADRGPADRRPADREPDSRPGQAEDGGTAPWDMAGDWSPASGTAALDAWSAEFPATKEARGDAGARAGTGPRESTGSWEGAGSRERSGSREGSGSRESGGSWGTGPWEVTGPRDDATPRERSGSRESAGSWGTGPWEVTGPRDDATSRERSDSLEGAGSWGTTGAWEDTGSWGNTESRGSTEPREGTGPREAIGPREATGPREAAGPREGATSRESASSRESGGFRGNTARRDDPTRLPGQRSSTPESPVLGTPVAETRPPWDAEPHRAPWESGPQAPLPATDPVSPAGTRPTTGAHRRLPWASTPANSRPAAPTAPQPAARTGAQPVLGTGSQPASRTGGPAASGTPAEPIYWTGPQPVARTGEQPVARTGSQPVARSDAQPVARTGAQPALGTGPQHVSWARPEPVTGTGGHPVSRTGTQPAVPTGPQPTARAPWESGDWGKAPDWDAITGQREIAPAAPEPEPEPARGRDASGAAPAAGRPAKPERHSHRAAKHGKPSRWRGSGNRSSGDGES